MNASVVVVLDSDIASLGHAGVEIGRILGRLDLQATCDFNRCLDGFISLMFQNERDAAMFKVGSQFEVISPEEYETRTAELKRQMMDGFRAFKAGQLSPGVWVREP